MRTPANLLVIAGVLNNTVDLSKDTELVYDVTDVFLHEEYDHDTLINDIDVIKVGLIFTYEKQIFYILVDRKYIFI